MTVRKCCHPDCVAYFGDTPTANGYRHDSMAKLEAHWVAEHGAKATQPRPPEQAPQPELFPRDQYLGRGETQ